MKAVCYDHRDRDTRPPTCATCARIAVEHDIVTRTVEMFLAAGFKLRIEDEADEWTNDRDQILAVLFDLDDAFLIAKRDAFAGWVRFVFGNEGFTVISDYTVNLEDLLSPINKYADSLST